MDIRLKTKLFNRLNRIYQKKLTEKWLDDFIAFVEAHKNQHPKRQEIWNERKVILITYGDVLKTEGESPLETLRHFCNNYLQGCISTIHILPFFPYSSDDGFSVMDFYQVNPDLGDWKDIEALEKDFVLMADLVANHASSQGVWFKQFLSNEAPGKDYFFCPPADFDSSQVIRPRSSPLLTPFETADGPKKVWTTFSADQVDLNYANPEVLKEMLQVFLPVERNPRHSARCHRFSVENFGNSLYSRTRDSRSGIALPRNHGLLLSGRIAANRNQCTTQREHHLLWFGR